MDIIVRAKASLPGHDAIESVGVSISEGHGQAGTINGKNNRPGWNNESIAVFPKEEAGIVKSEKEGVLAPFFG